jgi:hypothetical protein
MKTLKRIPYWLKGALLFSGLRGIYWIGYFYTYRRFFLTAVARNTATNVELPGYILFIGEATFSILIWFAIGATIGGMYGHAKSKRRKTRKKSKKK